MPSLLPAAFILASGVLLLLLRHLLKRRSFKHIRGPPSPSALFGHELALCHQDEIGSLEFQWMRDYGATWKLRGIFGTDMLMTADPKALQHIYHKSGYNYTKRMSQNFLTYVIAGPGIVAVLGKEHQRHRKIMNPAFSAAQLRSFLPLFQHFAGRLSEKWRNELSTVGEQDILLNKWIARATLDVIGEVAFDYDYNALDGGERSPITKVYENIFKNADYKPSKGMLLFRATWDYLPVPLLKLIRYIPMAPWTHLRHIYRLYAKYGKEIVREKRSEFDAEKQKKRRDIISILMKASSSADPNTCLNDEEIMAEMFTLTFAGHETISNSLTFLLYELAKHPEYQERMREEIKGVHARVLARGETEFTIEDLDSLTLTMNAIKETLRFHPISLGLPRVAVKDDVLPLAYPITTTTGEVITEIPVRAGQVISTSTIGYQHLTEVWGEDAYVWNPDRFFRADIGKQTNVGVFANLMTFSAGVRGCIGWRFSVIEMQAFVAELVNTFHFAPPAEKVDIKRAPAGTTMLPLIRGKEDLGTAMPIRVSLAQ